MNKLNKHINRILALAALTLAAYTADAQNTCNITGQIHRDSLRFSKQRIEKIYLCYTDEFDRFITKDSVMVKDGKFTINHKIKEGEPVMMYFLTGFDNGDIPIWIEPGDIQVQIPNAAFPAGAHIKGGFTNELYGEYKKIAQRCIDIQQDSINAFVSQYGTEYMNTPEANNRLLRLGAAALLACNAERIEFLLEHNDSPLAPLMFQKEIAYHFDAYNSEKLLKALSPVLHKHPYYRDFYNYIKAQNLKEGGELPDIKLPLDNGEVKYLSDFRGKYIVLDFWASWCGPCLKELPVIKQLYADMKDMPDRFTLISVSLDNKEVAWRDAMKKHDMRHPGWVHASDLLGWGSPSAKLLGIEAIPKIILIDPEGRAVSFKLRGEELIRKVKEIVR